MLTAIGVSGDEISNGHTEDSLISSRTSSICVNPRKRTSIHCQKITRRKYRHYLSLISGILFIFWGIAILIYHPYDVFMDLRTRMTPGLPPFEWWLNPPDEVICNLYIFNVTNSEEFMNGTDTKIKVKEIGPITYREKLIHTHPVFNENSTLTYTANRTPIYLPELNSVNLLNETIIVPNMGVLFIPSFLYNAGFFVKFGVNVMMRKLKSHPFQTTTVSNFLWNSTDPILDVSQGLAPNLVPTKNVGILTRIYDDYVDNVTVYIGPKFDERHFFLIDKYDGSEYLPSREKQCGDKLKGSSEGVSYPQRLSKNDTLRYFRKTLCKVVELKFDHEVHTYGLDAYKYVMDPFSYSRTSPPNMDCYKGIPTLPNGLIDVSPCYYDTALAASFPHFLYGDEEIKQNVEGLQPNKEIHESYVIVEPNTGIPLNGAARSQLNLVVKDMKGFNKEIQKFSNLSIPLVWIEYIQVGLPWHIHLLVYFQVVVLPVLQFILSPLLLIIGALLLYQSIRKKKWSRKNSIANKTLQFETETFLKIENDKKSIS
ncbi:hypothetical protein JTB14_018169 [Gonioctena quinquepunctata]|nr:hypothetical protein JTB14_018169 [Gonioctena quinquepunctata]